MTNCNCNTTYEHCDCTHKNTGQTSSIAHPWLLSFAEKIREYFFLKQSCLPPLHLVSLVKHLVHGGANIRRDKMVFQENSLRFSGLIFIIYMKKKRAIMDAYKFCQE